jgi:hypothetical protein
MKIIRPVVLGIGIAAILFELLFPPLRSPSPYYTQPQVVNNDFVAVHISRFSGWRPDLARLDSGAVLRTEIDGGELLREVVALAVIFGAAYLCAPAIVEQWKMNNSEVAPDAEQ